MPDNKGTIIGAAVAIVGVGAAAGAYLMMREKEEVPEVVAPPPTSTAPTPEDILRAKVQRLMNAKKIIQAKQAAMRKSELAAIELNPPEKRAGLKKWMNVELDIAYYLAMKKVADNLELRKSSEQLAGEVNRRLDLAGKEFPGRRQEMLIKASVTANMFAAEALQLTTGRAWYHSAGRQDPRSWKDGRGWRV